MWHDENIAISVRVAVFLMFLILIFRGRKRAGGLNTSMYQYIDVFGGGIVETTPCLPASEGGGVFFVL
ncbi:MAG: hypothetical protein A2986_00810 [Candidatus Jacksonbacteria bacterium RIFCSPLOWO2_01_FULL_44_13]|nr:MAG: hypothetical protein A2986_00810 [Candidatus Jacksonbacteria bacterium RIFCSPLOWO2_01_FULL_44_13]